MACELCSRHCAVDRKRGERGYCGMTEELLVARVAPHFFEEPCISGEKGSGTIFFSGCNLRCVYCQNERIAAGKRGKPYTIRELADAFLYLEELGCHNLNLVTPSHYIPQIREALLLRRPTIPVVYNTSSYESVEALASLSGLVDIYLADLKYVSSELARSYSHASDYPEVAKNAIAEMVLQTGGAVYDTGEGVADCYPDGALMKRGVIVRHLLLPGQVREAKRVIRYLYETYGNTVAISIMNQYTPMPNVAKYPELNRRVTAREYEDVVDYAVRIGVEHGFFQDGETASESFIPEFEID